jgi:hypothetical protein
VYLYSGRVSFPFSAWKRQKFLQKGKKKQKNFANLLKSRKNFDLTQNFEI